VLQHNQLALTHRAKNAEAVIGLSCRGSSSGVDLEESKEGDNIKKDGSILGPSCQSKVREGVDLEELSAVIDCFALLS
jgi:hypothetical protein